VSGSNSFVGRIVARDYDDAPVPFTGRVLGQVDEKTLKSRGEASRTPATREARTSRLTGCAPSGHKEVCICRTGAGPPCRARALWQLWRLPEEVFAFPVSGSGSGELVRVPVAGAG
jgi:hypothetical protein